MFFGFWDCYSFFENFDKLYTLSHLLVNLYPAVNNPRPEPVNCGGEEICIFWSVRAGFLDKAG